MLDFHSLLIGESPFVRDILAFIEKASQIRGGIHILGESGTGKELIAEAIHNTSSRASQSMVTVSCTEIPLEHLKVEFFGDKNDVVSEKSHNKRGKLEIAHGGTLFCDGIDCVPLELQVEILKVLQTGVFDIRFIATSHRDLQEAVQKKEFDERLYYFLNTCALKIPPLRERKNDVLILLDYFLKKENEINKHSVETPSGDVLEAFVSYDWPGNIKELEYLVKKLAMLKAQGNITIEELPSHMFKKYMTENSNNAGAVSEWEFPRMVLPHEGLDLKAIVCAFENHLVDQALVRTNGNKNRASELLSMNRTTLVEKLRKRGLIIPLSVAKTPPSQNEPEFNPSG